LPFHTFAARQLAAGKLALWDPYMFSGHPFQADIQTAVAYPIAAANEWLGGRGFGYLSLEWEAIVHFGLAATFTFLLVELLTGSAMAGLLGAVTFTFGGFLTSYPSQQLPVLESTVWLPLELYCLERAARALKCQPSRLHVAVQERSGPDSMGRDGGCVVPSLRLRASAWLALSGGMVGLSVLAGHPQTVLYLAYLGAAYFLFRMPWWSWWRAVWAVLPAAGLSAVQLLPTLQLFALNRRGGLAFGFAAGGLEPGDLAAILFDDPNGGRILYLGLVPLALALLAIVAVRSRQIVFWTVTEVVAVLLSLGTHGPLFRPFFDYLPGWDLFRDQERSVVWFAMGAAILAGYGLAWLCRLRLTWRWGGALAGVLVAASFGNLWWANAGNDLSAAPPNLDAVAGLLQPVMADTDIFRVRISEEALGHDTGNLFGLQFVSGDSPFELQAFKDWTEDEPAGHRVAEWQLLRLTNSHYVVSSRELCSPCTESDGLQLLGSAGVPAEARILESQRGASAPARQLYLYKVLFPLPRVLFFTQARPVSDERAAINALNQPDFDAATTLLLQGSSVPHSSSAEGASLRADLTGYAPGFLEARTSSDRPAYVYMSEVAYPDWRASIDGQPAKLLVADGLFNAVDVPPGDHHVVLQYVPKPFYLGAAVSGVTLLALIACVAASLVRGGRKASLNDMRVG